MHSISVYFKPMLMAVGYSFTVSQIIANLNGVNNFFFFFCQCVDGPARYFLKDPITVFQIGLSLVD